MIISYYMEIEPLLDEKTFDRQLLLLDRERQEKILRLHSREDRCRSLAGGLLLREGFWRQGIDHDLLRFTDSELGKPELDYRFVRELPPDAGESGVIRTVHRLARKGSGREDLGALRQRPPLERLLHFSVSHSGCYAVASFSDQDVGIDVERISRFGRRSMLERMSQRVLGADERSMYTRVAQDKRSLVFAWFWTRKEAYAKWDGRGIGMDFASIDCRRDQMFHTIRLDEDYWVSVCTYERVGYDRGLFCGANTEMKKDA